MKESTLQIISEQLDPRDALVASKIAERMLENEASKEEVDKFYEIARSLAEPDIKDLDEYSEWCDFMDNDPENWINFVENTFGKEWGTVARALVEFGY